MKDILERSDFENEVYSNNNEIREQFTKIFRPEIDIFIDRIYDTYLNYKQLDKEINHDEQKAYTAMFLYNAINSLTVSFNLLLSGHFIASGNLIRHFMESALMAVILSNNNLDYNYFELFKQEGVNFRVHKVFSIFERNIEKFDVDIKAWEVFKAIKNDYNLYSHPSAFAVTSLFDFSKSAVVIGSSFDEEKVPGYKKEISLRISANEAINNFIELIKEQFSKL